MDIAYGPNIVREQPQEWIAAYKQSFPALLSERRKGSIKLAGRARIIQFELQNVRLRRRLHISDSRWSIPTERVNERGDDVRLWSELMGEFKPLLSERT